MKTHCLFLLLAAAPFTIESCLGSTFTDSFPAGLNPTYWSTLQTISNYYTVTLPANQVQLAKTGGANPGGLQSVSIRLNLSQLGGSISNDFTVSVQITNAVVSGSGRDQVELHTYYQDGSIYFVSYDNSVGLNAHVWDGTSALGAVPLSTNAGVLTITRTGGTVSGYFNSTAIYSETRTAAVASVEFTLQNNSGSSDPISVTFEDFSLTSASVFTYAPRSGNFFYGNFTNQANFTYAESDSVPGEPLGVREPGAPAGLVTLSGVPFNIASSPSGKQAWHADVAANGGSGPVSLVCYPGIYGVTNVYSLINTWEGQSGPTSYAWFVFAGSGGAVYTNYLVGGVDICDYNLGPWENSLTSSNTINVFNCLMDNWGNPGRLDMQQMALPAAFATQTLTSVQLVDNGGPSLQRVILDGLTLQGAAVPVLAIVPRGNQLQVLWPAITGATLQTNANLSTANWVNYGGSVSTLGTSNIVTIAQPAGTLFFRLSLP